MPSDVIVDSEFLWCHTATSDKVYNVYVKGSRRQPTNYDRDCRVVAEWGRRGGTLKQEIKGEGLRYDTAKQMFNKLVAEKTSEKKGYRRADLTPVYNTPTTNPIMDIKDALQPNKVIKFRPAKKEKVAAQPPTKEVVVETERKLRFGAL
ncbi:MAG: WGR domain-containing protein [Nitrosomonadaceae bacterium]|nr:WGR domain-containing protein [Nitrosomonadaceae bacterium]